MKPWRSRARMVMRIPGCWSMPESCHECVACQRGNPFVLGVDDAANLNPNAKIQITAPITSRIGSLGLSLACHFSAHDADHVLR